MEWTATHLWLILALVLCLAELMSGVLVLLALGIAAALTSLLAYFGLSLELQLVGMGIASGLLVPLFIRKIRPHFSPKGVRYGTTGTGVERGRVYNVEKRDFDQATGIKVNGDFYRLRVEPTGESELPAGTSVLFQQFDGTTAIVRLNEE